MSCSLFGYLPVTKIFPNFKSVVEHFSYQLSKVLYEKAQGELGQTTIKSVINRYVSQNNLNALSPQTDVLNGVAKEEKISANFHEKFSWGILEISQNW